MILNASDGEVPLLVNQGSREYPFITISSRFTFIQNGTTC